MTGKTIDQVAVGDRAAMACTMTAALVTAFVTLSGDRNPIHRDATFAASTNFGEPIAPGMLTAALIASVIGNTITARVEVVETVRDRNRIRLRTECANGAGEIVLVGEAWVMPPSDALPRSRGGTAAMPLARAA